MKIQKQDIYHGAALCQVVQNEQFTALNRASDTHGHYIVNKDIELLVKYSAIAEPWQFTFAPEYLRMLSAPSRARRFVVLVCGEETICALKMAEIEAVINLAADGNQTIRIEAPPGRQLSVSGSIGPLTAKIPHRRFPRFIFE